MDGSGRRFMEEIDTVGIEKQDELRKYIVIQEPIEVRDGDKVAGVYPDRGQKATYLIDFAHSAIGRQEIQFELTPDSFRKQIAAARTFGFISDVEYLEKCGLIRGGSLENAVVLDHNGIVNNHLRYPDEFVRHKLLDLLGDISLVGYPIIGHLRAERAGHALHATLASKIARQIQRQRVCTIADLAPELTAAR